MEYTKKIENSDYYVCRDGYVIGVKGKILVPKLTKTGYHELNLYLNDGTKIYPRVHRLVAQAFIPNPDNKPFVNHIDGDKTNNCVENLEWVTHQENMEHAKNYSLVHRGERHKSSIHTEEQVHEICKLLQMGYRNCDIAESLQVQSYNISLIRSGTCWGHISCQYRIPERSRALSDSTIAWICKQLKQGLTVLQVLELSNNPKITVDIVADIKRKRIYKDISSKYF